MKSFRALMTMMIILSCGILFADLAYTIRNLNKGMHISGPTLSESDFENKVVLIEIWGKDCPPCRASLPKMAELANKYKKNSRALIIGAHHQGRADEAVRKLLADNKCDYPVYQFLSTSLEPSYPGIPFVYIINHKGELAWQGHPKNMAPIFEKLVKEVPNVDPNSILGVVELKAFKSYASSFRIGRNVERAIKQVEARKKRDADVEEEADAIIQACYNWAENVTAEISNNIETYPSKALIAYQRLLKTFPSMAAEFKEQIEPLAKDKITGVLVKARLDLEKKKKLPANTPNEKKRIASTLRMPKKAMDDLVKRMGEDVTEDALDVQKEWHNFYEKFAE